MICLVFVLLLCIPKRKISKHYHKLREYAQFYKSVNKKNICQINSWPAQSYSSREMNQSMQNNLKSFTNTENVNMDVCSSSLCICPLVGFQIYLELCTCLSVVLCACTCMQAQPVTWETSEPEATPMIWPIFTERYCWYPHLCKKKKAEVLGGQL